MSHLIPPPLRPPKPLHAWAYRLASAAMAALCLSTHAWAALTVNANGTVTDTTTSLVWDRCNYGRNNDATCSGTAFLGTWQQALDAVVAANAANGGSGYKGFNDWRLPNVKELESITKIDTYTAGQAAIDTTAFPNTPISGDSWGDGGTWTSTTYAPIPSSAWIVYFHYGIAYADVKTDTYYVRLVRSGQSFASFDSLASSQTITFANPGTRTGNFALNATATSSLAVAFTSSTPAVCTVSGSALTVVSAGTCTIKADQAGNGSFNAAAQVSQSFAVSNAPVIAAQAITLGAAPAVSMGASGTMTATGGGSGNALRYSSNTPTACSVSASGTVTGLAVGSNSCTIAVNQDGNASYSAAPQVTQTFSITPGTQSIAFGAAPSVLYTTSGTVTASGGKSGNPVVFASSTPSVCSVTSSGVVSGLGGGICTITANQAGNTSYNAAAQASQSFEVKKLDQTIRFGVAPTVLVGTMGTVTASSNYGNAITFASSTPLVCAVSSAGVVAGLAGSTCTVTANQAGNANYNAASLSQSFSVVAGGKVTVAAGSTLSIPCNTTSLCASGQSNLTALAGEVVTFAPNGQVTNIELGQCKASTQAMPVGSENAGNLADLNQCSSTRFNGKSLIDAIVEALQLDNPSLGTSTERTVDSWGALAIGFASGKLSVGAQMPIVVNASLPDGVRHLPNGSIQVVTHGVVVNLVPTVLDLAGLTDQLQALTPPARLHVRADGSLLVGYNGLLYALQPGMFSTNGTDSAARSGFAAASGQLRFVSVNGNTQTSQNLPPAVYHFEQFAQMLAKVDAKATVTVQADGKLAVTIQGKTYLLAPDYALSSPDAVGGFFSDTPRPDFEVKDGKLIANYPYGFSQGFGLSQ